MDLLLKYDITEIINAIKPCFSCRFYSFVFLSSPFIIFNVYTLIANII